MLPDTSTIANYGGALDNYRPVVDPTTDRDADAMNEALCDVAMMSHTSIRAIVKFTGHATTPVLVSHWAQWGDGPSVAPTVTRTALGTVEIAWPSTVTDELAATRTLQVRDGWGNVRSNGRVWVEPHGSTTYKAIAHLMDAAGAANDLAATTITVFVV